jgi:hypothetical protein
VAAKAAATAEPLVVLLNGDAGGEPDRRSVVGVDADDIGTAADLAVTPLNRIA